MGWEKRAGPGQARAGEGTGLCPWSLGGRPGTAGGQAHDGRAALSSSCSSRLSARGCFEEESVPKTRQA